MNRCYFLAIGISVCLLSDSILAAKFTPLGFLPDGYFYSSAQDVSEDGRIVVGTAHQGGVGNLAYRWTAATGMQSLGDLPGGDIYSQAIGISADGRVIIGQGTVGEYAIIDAFRWTADEGMQPIGYFPYDGVRFNYTQGVSADGKVIVGASSSNEAMVFQAYRWTAETGLESLGDLPGGDVWSIAGNVSADGRVIVGESQTAVGREAFRWTAETGMQGLGIPPGLVQESHVTTISPDGVRIFGYSGRKGWRWTQVDGFQFVEPLSSNLVSVVRDTSWDGTIAVGTASFSGDATAVVWDESLSVQKLQDILENDHGLDLTGWQLRNASAISGDGTVIVGDGIGPSGRTQAWIVHLAVPEPTSLAIAILTMTGCAMLRDRRR